jgi:hypothetical protein
MAGAKPLLFRHSVMDDRFRFDEMIVAVVAGGHLNPFDGAGEALSRAG